MDGQVDAFPELVLLSRKRPGQAEREAGTEHAAETGGWAKRSLVCVTGK